MWGTFIDGVECICKEELYEKRKKALIVVCVAFEYVSEVINFLTEEKFYFMSCYEFLFIHMKRKFIESYKKLSDKKSKKIFKKQLQARFAFKEKKCEYLFEENQYFCLPEFRKIDKNMCFIDIGAFVGDTLESFLNLHSGIFDSYYAFEPDKENYIALQKRIERLNCEWNLRNKIFSIDMGVSDKIRSAFINNPSSTNMSFYLSNENDNTSSKINEIGITTIDSYFENINLQGKKIILKADIEGSELFMLKGAEKFILKYKPLIAICIYHNPEDFFEIPLYLSNLIPSYQFSIRHHSFGDYETVLYCY